MIAFTAASLGIIKAASNIQELLEANEPEIFVIEGDIDPSIPPFDLSEVPRYDPERFPNNNDFLDDILDGQYEFPDAEEGGSYFLASESSGATGLYTPDSADILLNSQEDITLELFGGTTGQLPGAINIDIIAEQGIRADLLTDGLSFIPSNSVDEIVTFNPFIPKDAGGTGILDYLPEAARTLFTRRPDNN